MKTTAPNDSDSAQTDSNANNIQLHKKSNKRGKKKDEESLVRYAGGVSKGKSSHPRYSFVVRWPGENGKRMAKWFVSDTEAKAWAQEKSADAGELGDNFASLSESERGAVAAYRALVTKYEHPKPDSLAKIVKDYAKRFEASRAGATVAVATTAFIAAKKAEGRSKGHLVTLGVRLGRFTKDYGDRVLPSFTTSELSDYILNLRGLVMTPDLRPPSGRMRKDGTPVKRTYRQPIQRKEDALSLETKSGYRRAIHSLFEWARKRGMVPENPMTDTDKPTGKPKLPGILTADDTKSFFDALAEHAPSILPVWAVRAFAGVREAEALRMDWRMIDLPNNMITLPATITKTRSLREIKIEPVLAAWLTPYAKTSGPVCSLSPMARSWRLRLALRSLPKLSQPRNWARHSYATYHLLAFRHAGETAMQLGHGGSPEVLHKHYKGVSTEAEAKAFWAIRPTTPVNVVSMGTAADEVEETSDERKAQ
jgi:integrase